jgi:hypothetical protein
MCAKTVLWGLLVVTGSAFLNGSAGAERITWEQTLGFAGMTKDGLGALNQPDYQYDIIGLAGTTLRVGPHGFTSPGAPNVLSPADLQYSPYLTYQYWWDEDSHRREPFEVIGGYAGTSPLTWRFDTPGNTEDWARLPDTVVSQNNGDLVLTYVNDSGSGTEWLEGSGADVRFAERSFAGSDYPYLYVEYECVNWPTSNPVWCNMGYYTTGSTGYGHFQIDPTKNSFVINMHDSWSNVLWGPDWSASTITGLRFEVPWWEDPASAPVSNWLSSSFRIRLLRVTSDPAGQTDAGNQVIDPGTIESFHHDLDVSKGTLSIDLGLNVAGNTFASQRREFVTPEGVWVIQISDSAEALQPFVLRIAPPTGYAFSAEAKLDGMVITATAAGAATGVLAIACENADVINLAECTIAGTAPGSTVTLYIAPSSSYKPGTSNPANDAWVRAAAARTNGYQNQRQTTGDWWAAFNGRHQVTLPNTEAELAKWYARSLYYHGVFFGNTDIPPGIWGNSAFPGGGAVCPEHDLVFSQLAALYTNHVNESARIVDWLWNTLGQAQQNVNTTIYDCSISHTRGAKYGWWVGYDGKYLMPGASWECVNLYSNYPNANCATMAVKHADFTRDSAYGAIANGILLKTTQLAVDDQAWSSQWGGYLDYIKYDVLQQSACLYGLTESIAHGIAEPSWAAMVSQVYFATGPFRGNTVIVGYPGNEPTPGYGDAPYLYPVWWYGFVGKDSPLAKPTWDMITLTGTRNYTFNRATMSVVASKLYDVDNAYAWAVSLFGPDVVHGDATISEMVWDAHDFKRTPEIAAHGGLVCALTEMLVDPDVADTVYVFPAVPSSWLEEGVGFQNILVKGGILVSAEISQIAGVNVTMRNIGVQPVIRQLRLRLPDGITALRNAPKGAYVEDGWAVCEGIDVAPYEESQVAFTFDNGSPGIPATGIAGLGLLMLAAMLGGVCMIRQESGKPLGSLLASGDWTPQVVCSSYGNCPGAILSRYGV